MGPDAKKKCTCILGIFVQKWALFLCNIWAEMEIFSAKSFSAKSVSSAKSLSAKSFSARETRESGSTAGAFGAPADPLVQNPSKKYIFSGGIHAKK